MPNNIYWSAVQSYGFILQLTLQLTHLDGSFPSPSLTPTSSNEGSLTTVPDSDTPFREDMLRNTIPLVRDVVHIFHMDLVLPHIDRTIESSFTELQEASTHICRIETPL
jgi:hypothetical protein